MLIPIRFKKAGWLMFSAFAAVGLLWSCEFDQGLGSSKTKISGRIIFADSAMRPDSLIEEVRVVATASLPPAGFGEVYFSNPVRDFDRDTATYAIAAPRGTYAAIGVLWKPRGRDWSFTNLLGIYDVKLFPLPAFTLKSVQLSEEHPVVDTVDISAYWSFSKFDARIEGELTLLGDWPPDTEIVLLGAFVDVPVLNDPGSLLGVFLTGLPLPISPGAQKRPYGLAVRGGEYKFIGIFWKAKGTGFNELRLVGFYRDPRDASRPGTVTVSPSVGATMINFVADFNTLPDGLRMPSGR